MSINIHLYQSTCTNESRIFKITKSLSSKNYFREIHIVGMHDKGLKKVEYISSNIKIIRVRNFFHALSPDSKLRYLTLIEWNIRVLFIYLFKNIQCINAHSVPVLPVSFLLKVLKGAILVYDTHELETETETVGVGKRLSKLVEQVFIRASDYVVVVGNSIRDWYKKQYDVKNIIVIKNIPNATAIEERQNLKGRFGVPLDHVLFIYQGNLSGLRGVNEIISVFQQGPKDKHILFMGFGDLESRIKDLSTKEKNIHYLPAVPPNKILNYTAGADIGIHIIPNSCLNNYYCLPNKLYEYVLAGIPFIGSNFPDIQHEFGDTGVAWLINPDQRNLFLIIERLTKDDIDRYKQNCAVLLRSLTWEIQEPVLFTMYDKLLGKA